MVFLQKPLFTTKIRDFLATMYNTTAFWRLQKYYYYVHHICLLEATKVYLKIKQKYHRRLAISRAASTIIPTTTGLLIELLG